MTPERWQQVAALYESVLALRPEARGDYLATASRDDPDLRREVESLLENADRSVVVDGSVWDAAVPIVDVDSEPELASGTHVGPYRVDAMIGVGGMGQVYRAHDAKLQRDVALKILSDAVLADRDRVARFTREARVLASLSTAFHKYGDVF